MRKFFLVVFTAISIEASCLFGAGYIASSLASLKPPPFPTPFSSPAPSPIPSTETSFNSRVNVSINNSSKFDISIPEEANHCDVLTKALSEGKISSLNMRFDQNYGSYAVYQIDGLGKENSVWWVYEVNDQKLSQGCSYVKAKNGDKIKWEYLGS